MKRRPKREPRRCTYFFLRRGPVRERFHTPTECCGRLPIPSQEGEVVSADRCEAPPLSSCQPRMCWEFGFLEGRVVAANLVVPPLTVGAASDLFRPLQRIADTETDCSPQHTCRDLGRREVGDVVAFTRTQLPVWILLLTSPSPASSSHV
jgi:hypothetical protein